MLSIFEEISENFERLERQKIQLIEDMKELRRKAEEKVLLLECEVASLLEDAEILKKITGTF